MDFLVRREFFQDVRGQRLSRLERMPETWEGAIAIGRAPALATGLVTPEQIDDLGQDGYIVAGRNNTIAIVGRRPIGTYWGAMAFIEKCGGSIYPTQYFGRAFEHQRRDELPPFTHVSKKPYFNTRFGNHYSRGLHRSLFKDLGNASKADPSLVEGGDPIYSDHTAAYLVPKEYYMEEHPEYFAEIRGQRLDQDTRHHRLTLNLSHPDVNRISAERALEWIAQQSDRRFFRIDDGDDTRCQCSHCVATDYIPDYYTDRHLRWVNHVARAVAEKYPEKQLTTVAYIETAEAPLHVTPEDNVIVFYCPWFWMARNADKPPWHYRNVYEMQDMVDWMLNVPRKNLGRQNYTMGLDTDSRILKWQAKQGIVNWRGNHGDQLRGLYAYIMAKLSVDPFLDRGVLERQYCEALFDEAAEPMLEAVREMLTRRRDNVWFLHHATASQLVEHYRTMTGLLDEALEVATDDSHVRALIISEVALGWQDWVTQLLARRLSESAVRPAVERYLEFYIAKYDTLPERHWQLRRWNEDPAGAYERLEEKLAGWGYALRPPKDDDDLMKDLVGRLVQTDNESAAAEPQQASQDLLLPERTLDSAAQMRLAASDEEVEQKRSRTVRLDTPAIAASVHTSQTEGAPEMPDAELVEFRTPGGAHHAGIAMDLPFTGLPEQDLPLHENGMQRVHTGMFYAGVELPQAVNAEGLNSYEFHIHASTPMNIEFIVDVGRKGERPHDMRPRVGAQVRVNAGEQVIRIDLKNLRRSGWEWQDYIGELRGFKIIAHPQDNYYPFPPVQDGRLTIFSLTARNHVPPASKLPRAGRAIWLSQFGPNHRFKLQELGGDIYRPEHRYGLERPRFQEPLGLAREKEAFRTNTPQRIVAPIYGIIADDRVHQQAEILQRYLEVMFGVTLPINPDGMAATVDQGNAIFLGKRASLSAGAITETELTELAREEGFMIRARNGRIAIAGNSPAGTAYGIADYLEKQGVSFHDPAGPGTVPDKKGRFLRETVFFDWPYFDRRPIAGGWKWQSEGPPRRVSGRSDIAHITRMSKKIKDLAREGEPVTSEVIEMAGRSSAASYVASKLLWDPFANTSYLIREFKSSANSQR